MLHFRRRKPLNYSGHTSCPGLFEFGWLFLVQKRKPFHRRLTVAEHVLLRNDLNQDEFAEAVRVEFYCVKENIVISLLVAAKHFITPLNSVFQPFCNPGTTTIALVDTVSTDSDEVILSNDVRWCP